MSEPDRAAIGRRIGDDIENDAVACCAATGTARPPDFTQHQGQVGHRGRQVQLESRFDPTEVTGLPYAQLDQSRQPMLCHYSARSILVVVGAPLQRSGLLQEGFLRMDLHPASFTALGRDAFGPPRARPTDLPIKLESLQSIDTTRAVSPFPGWHDGAGNLSGRTGTTARGQVKVKVMLGKVFPVGSARRFGHQPASHVGEGLAGPAVPIGGVAHGFLHRPSGTRFAGGHRTYQRVELGWWIGWLRLGRSVAGGVAAGISKCTTASKVGGGDAEGVQGAVG